MVGVTRENVSVTRDGLAIAVTSCHVTLGAPNMASARMELVYAPKAGMANTAPCVSGETVTGIHFSSDIWIMLICVINFGDKEEIFLILFN